jgi:OOP family OmpA-OmpF porin
VGTARARRDPRGDGRGRGARLLALVAALACAAQGCAAGSTSRAGCRVAAGLTGATLGAVAGGVGADQIDSAPDNLEIASAAAIGFLAGGAIGLVAGTWACPAEAAPPAPEPTAPAPAPTPAPRRKLVLRGVGFEFDRAVIRPDDRAVLDEAVRALAGEPGARVSVEGHTDDVGAEAYNQGLSERRARAVADHLAAGGIARARLSTVGYGEARPLASNATAEGRAQNRRVELRVVAE